MRRLSLSSIFNLHSLRIRLLLMFMFVALASITIYQIVVSQSTYSAFENYVNGKAQSCSPKATDCSQPLIACDIQDEKCAARNWQTNTKLQSQLAATASGNRAMANVVQEIYTDSRQDMPLFQKRIEQLQAQYSVHLFVLDQNKRVISDSSGLKNGEMLSANLTTNILPTTATLEIPTLIIMIDTHTTPPPVDKAITPEQNYQASVQGLLWAAFGLAVIMSLLLSVLCSNMIIKPIKKLTLVANRMAKGDLSQRVHMRTKSEIGILGRAFNTMADSLAHQEQLRRNLVSDVAHELRTPLTNIRGYLEALQDGVIEPTIELIASLYEEALLLNRLVADLQELSLAEAGQLCLVRQQVRPDELIQKALQAAQPQATQKAIKLIGKVPDHLPLIEVDPARISQILRNLLNNAIIHTSLHGQICIEASMPDLEDAITISVEDTGEGIEEAHLPYIFERFYRADPSRSRTTGGTGLGLAIVRQLVIAHGGEISVRSHPGKGTCFMMSLPLKNSLKEHSEAK